MTALRVGTWNINGLPSSKTELELLMNNNQLDVVLVSEAHCTSKSKISIKGCHIYVTNHPDGTGHAGTAVVIRKSIKHQLLPEFRTNHIQATTVAVETRCGQLNLSAVYCPPRHTISATKFTDYFATLGRKFVAGGDWNAKNTYWGSRLTTTRGRQLKLSLEENGLSTVSSGEPTYWPTDTNKKPDLLDFFIVKGLSRNYLKAETCLDSNSDHTPVLLTISTTIIHYDKPDTLYNNRTDWEGFKDYIENNIELKVSLKTPDEIDEATQYITNLIQKACWTNTPIPRKNSQVVGNVPLEVKHKILEKRKLRRIWHQTRNKSDKTALNRAIRELKNLIDNVNNATLQNNLENLTTTKSTDHSLWKFTKALVRPQQYKCPIKTVSGWTRTSTEKANMFGEHLANIFKPNDSNNVEFENAVESTLQQDLQLSTPPRPVTIQELKRTIIKLQNKKAPGFDLITKEIVTELPKKALVFLVTLFNSVLRVQHFPRLWKVSIVTMVHKPGKPPEEPTSYRPISLLPVLSKMFERILLSRILPILNENKIVPRHQFGFRQQHSTIEQVHRVCEKIRSSLENKEYCSAVFLDIQAAFDKVWHKGLLYKIKAFLPHSYYPLMKSYLIDRIFQVREDGELSNIHDIMAGVPQGTVLGPVLYTIYTADLPETQGVTTATFADDTALLASSTDPAVASATLQNNLDKVTEWLQKWRIKANTTKSVHITFTLRKGSCASVKMCDITLPQCDTVRYLGMHLDKRLTWKKHIQSKRDELNMRFKNIYWLMARNSKLSTDNKLLIYKMILKPIWTYGLQLWGSACDSSLNIMQRMQNGILRTIANVPWFVTNTEIHEAMNMRTVKEEIRLTGTKYRTRLENHPNTLANELTKVSYIKRLKRHDIQGVGDR